MAPPLLFVYHIPRSVRINQDPRDSIASADYEGEEMYPSLFLFLPFPPPPPPLASESFMVADPLSPIISPLTR